jgi:hypothetical protein
MKWKHVLYNGVFLCVNQDDDDPVTCGGTGRLRQ